jgi:phosphoribosyl-ATP pyrophosphohydrolase/phosphoribosyl-AMP cyclohydrolase/histidinol dehydrogenase
MSATESPVLRRVRIDEIPSAAPRSVDEDARTTAARIIDAVRAGGLVALREFALRLDGLARDEPIVIDRRGLQEALDATPARDRRVLEASAQRIEAFARTQRTALIDASTDVLDPRSGVRIARAGHRVVPVGRVGCYAPGGRHPLPSSVLMTAITARVAGVESVTVASPRPLPIVRAAAAIAGADMLLCAGGAQAIAALAFGTCTPSVHMIVGPGNRFVTAAKQLLFGAVGIDLPAGPSELVLVIDRESCAERAAADLLAQAEHDPDARPILIAPDEDSVARVEAALERQLRGLPTAAVAREALSGGFSVVAASQAEVLAAIDAIAPEHLSLSTRAAGELEPLVRNAGAVFIGERSGEIFGDYGVGPNHVLPTGGAARYSAGLSVLSFLRARTWIELESDAAAGALVAETAAFARIEGLEAHARAAEARGV